MNSIIFIALVVVLLLAAIFFVPQWRLKRAIRQVIQILREHSAIDTKSAKTVEELELKPRSMMDGMFKGRDYKPHAVNMLTRNEIIQQTEDGRLYLSEERLYASRLEKGPYHR